MKFCGIIFFLLTLVFLNTQTGLCDNLSLALNSTAMESSLTLDEILNRVEKRYAGAGFSARFDQVSTIKAMEISDTAFGKIFIKRPGMMRWEYEKPEKQIIITDGKKLWIYRPEDKQVMVGNAPSYFGEGKGANFLSDIKRIRRNFNITLEKSNRNDYYLLKLLPGKKSFDLSVIYLSISKKTFDVVQIVTLNAYEDENKIKLSNFQFKENLSDLMFSFQPPEGTDIINLED